MNEEIMKPTVIGSKWASFDVGSKMENWFFPNNNLHSYVLKHNAGNYDNLVDITILQVKVTPYGDKLRYTVEYIECE